MSIILDKIEFEKASGIERWRNGVLEYCYKKKWII
jgi:hypothetical protein